MLNKKLKYSFKKCINNFYFDELYIYSLLLPYDKFLYLSSIYNFLNIIDTSNELYNNNLLNFIKYKIHNKTFKTDYIYNYFKSYGFYNELLSFFYTYNYFKLDFEDIENLIQLINEQNKKIIYKTYKTYETYEDLDDFLGKFSKILNKLLNKIIFEFDFYNSIKFIYLTRIINNIKNDFKNNKIFLPKNLKNFIKSSNYNYDLSFSSINKISLESFNIFNYLNYIIYKNGDLFRISNDDIFSNIIFIIIIFNYKNLLQIEKINNQIKPNYYKIYFYIINFYKNILDNIIKNPLQILENKLNLGIFSKIKILGIRNCGKIIFNNYFYYIKLYF